MLTALMWTDATSDTSPIAWRTFNRDDLEGTRAWIETHKQSHDHGFVRVSERVRAHNRSGLLVLRDRLMMQVSW